MLIMFLDGTYCVVVKVGTELFTEKFKSRNDVERYINQKEVSGNFNHSGNTDRKSMYEIPTIQTSFHLELIKNSARQKSSQNNFGYTCPNY